jgi:hypothetical protein
MATTTGGGIVATITVSGTVKVSDGRVFAINHPVEFELSEHSRVLLANGKTQKISFGNVKTRLQFLLVTATAYSEKLRYSLNGGAFSAASPKLDGPLLLMSENSLSQLDAQLTSITIQNNGGPEVGVEIFAARPADGS